MDTFKSFIPSFVEIVKDTEPEALQFEAFANEQTNEIIWLESYADNTGFDVHIANPALNDLKQAMMPLQASIEGMYFMSAPTKPALEGLQQYGLEPNVLTPWPGTIRLQEARKETSNIQIFITMELSDLSTYREISTQVEQDIMDLPGILFHRSYQLNDRQVVVLEEYQDSDALMTWMNASAKYAEKLGRIIQGLTCDVCGNPSPAIQAKLKGWGANYYSQVAGFKRFSGATLTQ